MSNLEIYNESDLRAWFRQNFKELGFDSILRIHEHGDYICTKNGKEVRVELELKSSNFLSHGHNPKEIDILVCVEQDVIIPVPTIIISLKLSTVSIEKLSKVHTALQTTIEKILTQTPLNKNRNISDLSRDMNISWTFAKKCVDIIRLIRNNDFKLIILERPGSKYHGILNIFRVSKREQEKQNMQKDIELLASLQEVKH